MLKLYVKGSETLRQLRSDAKGVVSFEYVIVAAAIIVAVGAAFATGGTNLTTALQGAITTLGTKLNAAINGGGA
jgi:pilus assembly protein Flp/PilA